MFDFFEKILGYVESFFEFFVNIAENTFTVLEVLTKAVVFPTELAGIMPNLIGACMLTVVSVSVIKFIIGR